MKSTYLYIVGGLGAVALSALLAWFIFLTAPAPASNTSTVNSTDLSGIDNSAITQPQGSGNGASDSSQTGTSAPQQRIFELSAGPVAGATFVEATRPTTTIARFIMADNGHVFDLALDSQGAVAKAVSNTTIPGVLSAQWAGESALIQYLDGSTPKTLYLSLPPPDATSSPARLQFFPDGITSAAVSPKGDMVAYILRGNTGVAGYTSKPDGTGSKQLFKLPLSQVQLRWPSEGTLLAYSNAAAGVPGIAFAITASSGVTTPLVYAPGLTATADPSFDYVLYRTDDGSHPRSFSHSVANGSDEALSFSPLPEQCIPVPSGGPFLVCAASLNALPTDYLDLWHQGAANAADSLFLYNLVAGTSTLITTPGGSDGGVPTDMLQLGVSPDGRYLLYISKEDRSLWAVRVSQ